MSQPERSSDHSMDLPYTPTRDSQLGADYASVYEVWTAEDTPVRNIALHLRTPYLDPMASTEAGSSYMANGMLPGNMPDVGYRSPEFRLRFLSLLTDFDGASIEEKRIKREAYTRKLYERVKFKADCICPLSFDLDPWMMIHSRDYEYARALSLHDPTGNGHPFQFDDNHILFTRPLLRGDFRFSSEGYSNLEKNGKTERRFRSSMRIMADFRRHEIRHLNELGRTKRFPALTPWWTNYEVPHGLSVPLPASFYYSSLSLIQDPTCPWWTLFIHEWIASISSFWMWTLYTRYELWFLPPVVCRGIRALRHSLSFVLGNPATYDELISYLDMMDDINWDQDFGFHPYSWYGRDHSSGPIHHGTNYVLYNPFRKERLNRNDLRRELEMKYRPRLGAKAPQGYVYHNIRSNDRPLPWSNPRIVVSAPVRSNRVRPETANAPSTSGASSSFQTAATTPDGWDSAVDAADTSEPTPSNEEESQNAGPEANDNTVNTGEQAAPQNDDSSGTESDELSPLDAQRKRLRREARSLGLS